MINKKQIFCIGCGKDITYDLFSNFEETSNENIQSQKPLLKPWYFCGLTCARYWAPSPTVMGAGG